jgi:hypothetical protein
MPHPGTIQNNPFGATPNDWGVQVFTLVDANRSNASMSFHGVSIGAGRDGSGGLAGTGPFPVGRITSWNPQVYSREATHSYELSANATGKPVDITPGSNTGYTASFSRTEVWAKEAEVAFGLTETDAVFEDLCDQDRPFQVDEILTRGRTAVYRRWKYRGAWFTSLNANEYSPDSGDYRVSRSGELKFVRRERVQ